MEFVGRPETISCERCNTSVAVKAKGPIPAFCADCRRKRSRNGHTRPTVVNCQRCSNEITVQARGPLPRFCRNGCTPALLASPPNPTREVTPAAASGQGVVVAIQPATVLRPWDRTEQPETSHPDETPEPVTPTEPASSFTPTVTRIDTPHPSSVVGRVDIGRSVRVRHIKQAAAVGAWLAIIAIIALILLVGSRPAPPQFDSYLRLIV